LNPPLVLEIIESLCSPCSWPSKISFICTRVLF
jgi:hypothetical protein